MSLILACIFVILGLLRWCTTSGAIWWLRAHGRAYGDRLRKCDASDLTGRKIRAILDNCGGQRVFPWGVLEYKLHGRSRMLQILGRRIYRLPTLPVLALITYFSLGRNGHTLSHAAWCVVATVYQIGIILSAVEAIYSYIAIGGYRRYYHVGIRLSDDAKPNIKDEMYELEVIVPLGLSAVAINVLAVIAAQIGWNSFTSSQMPLDPTHPWSLLVHSIYFIVVTMTTIGYGDIIPANQWGEVISMLVSAQSLLLIIGLFATMVSFGIRLSEANTSERRS